MTKRTMESLRNAFKTPERRQGASNYYPFFLMKVDQEARVRFIPDKNEENPMQFLVEKVVHNLVVNGNKIKTPCLSMYDEECPICATSQQFYKAGDEDNGKKFWKKREHLGQVLVLKDPLPADDTGETHEGKVRFINLGFQLFGIIKNAFESGDLDVPPFDFEDGYDFIIKKSQQGEWGTYTLGSNFARRSTSLDDDQIALIEEEMVDLSTLLPAHPGLEKTEGLLNAALTGEDYVESSSDSTSSFATAVQNTRKKKAETVDEDEDDVPFETEEEEVGTKSASNTTSEPAEEEDQLDANAEAIIAKIRNRKRKKA